MDDAQEKEIKSLLGNKDLGKLLVSIYVPPGGIYPPSADVLWCGRGQIDPYTEAERKGFVPPLHPAFGNCYHPSIKLQRRERERAN